MMNRSSLQLAEIFGLVAGMNPVMDTFPITRSSDDDWPRSTKPDQVNTGRRAEKAAEALRKAQAKRDMKNAKRIGATKG